MTHRHTLTLTLALLATACSQTHDGSEGGDAGAPVPADGGDGVCCPIADFEGCYRGGAPLAGGGWAATGAACDFEIEGSSVSVSREVDDRGCPVLGVRGVGCGGSDAGMPPPPPPPGEHCEAYTVEGDCLAAGCVPTYHDACCSMCEPGGFCADCVDYELWECRPFADACMAAFCGTASDWGCGGAEPDCGDAVPTDSGSCSQIGCVPAVAAEGFMDPVEPCVPVTAQTCRTACRSVMPNCPDGMTAEADGFCWTGRCIPAGVCGR